MFAKLHEIFPSIQGEGSHIGLAFLFLRFSGCNLNCDYCDTGASRHEVESCVLYSDFDSRESTDIPNPIECEKLCKTIHNFGLKRLALTGGEPLMQAEFIAELLNRELNQFILLETNGSLPEAVSSELIRRVDLWSVDIKLPSVCGFDITDRHLAFLGNMKDAGAVELKTVFGPQSSREEIDTALKLAEYLHLRNDKSSLVFQPVSKEGRPAIGDSLRYVWEVAKRAPLPVRVIPQTHPILNIK